MSASVLAHEPADAQGTAFARAVRGWEAGTTRTFVPCPPSILRCALKTVQRAKGTWDEEGGTIPGIGNGIGVAHALFVSACQVHALFAVDWPKRKGFIAEDMQEFMDAAQEDTKISPATSPSASTGMTGVNNALVTGTMTPAAASAGGVLSGMEGAMVLVPAPSARTSFSWGDNALAKEAFFWLRVGELGDSVTAERVCSGILRDEWETVCRRLAAIRE